MWQPVTDHELAWEYLQAGLLWYGTPEREEMYAYPENYPPSISKERFLQLCISQGTDDGYTHPHYIHLED